MIDKAFRVLMTGGRLAISDIVATRELREDVRNTSTFLNAGGKKPASRSWRVLTP